MTFVEFLRQHRALKQEDRYEEAASLRDEYAMEIRQADIVAERRARFQVIQGGKK